MIFGSTRKLRVYAHTRPVDMRKSYDGLAALVQGALGRDLLEGDAFLFVGKDRRRAKALFWDGTGLCLFQKRLEKGRFAKLWRDDDERAEVALTLSELALFFEGSVLVGKKSLSPAEFHLDTDGAVMKKAISIHEPRA